MRNDLIPLCLAILLSTCTIAVACTSVLRILEFIISNNGISPRTNLINIKNFSGGLLHFTHLVHEVPESRLGNNFVDCEKLHAKCRRILVSLGGGFTAHHLKELHSSCLDVTHCFDELLMMTDVSTKQQLFVPTKTPSYIAITRRPRFFRIGEWWVISTTTQRLLCGTILASSSDTTFFPWGNFYISFQVVSVEVGCRT